MKSKCILIIVAALLPALIFPAAAAPDAKGPDTHRVQAAIDGGLKWLAENQITEGSLAGTWEASRYHSAVAGLAGLAFLANGHRPGEGEYGRVIDRAMNYVQQTMTSDGYLGAKEQQMYVHAIATLFGLSYLGTTRQPEKEKELAEWCRRSLKLIARAQAVRKPAVARGGWRYAPDADVSDLSVTSWMLLVLHAARQCGFPIDEKSVDAGMKYVNRAYHEKREVIRDKGKIIDEREIRGFLYRPGTSNEAERAATGVAVFIKSIFEAESDRKMQNSLAFLTEKAPDWNGSQYNGYFFFVSFYITQGMFQTGGAVWNKYAAGMKTELVANQAGDGHWPFPQANKEESRQAGTAYSTAMAILILSLEKQYLPMYQRQRKLF